MHKPLRRTLIPLLLAFLVASVFASPERSVYFEPKCREMTDAEGQQELGLDFCTVIDDGNPLSHGDVANEDPSRWFQHSNVLSILSRVPLNWYLAVVPVPPA